MGKERQPTVGEFEVHVIATNRLDKKDPHAPLLGLVGEIGSLLAAFKKKTRDKDAYFGYHAKVVEELGDVMWYTSLVAQRGGTSLAEVLAEMPGNRAGVKNLTFGKALSSVSLKAPKTSSDSLLMMASESGDLAKRFAERAYIQNVPALRGDLLKLLRSLVYAAKFGGVDLDAAIAFNLTKTDDRWPVGKRIFPRPTDYTFHIDEQLPRKMRVLVYEREVNGTKFVFQKIGKVLVGDRLTDNHYPQDDYRFHDVFHLAHATVLGWSPTTRALLKIKRKSEKALDENEDGARANLIEEGLTTWIFEIAKRHRFFVDTPELGFDTLKSVKQFVYGYEADKIPMWLWESAILQGYAVFRKLQSTRHGVVVTDMDKRKIWYEPMTDSEKKACGLRLNVKRATGLK